MDENNVQENASEEVVTPAVEETVEAPAEEVADAPAEEVAPEGEGLEGATSEEDEEVA